MLLFWTVAWAAEPARVVTTEQPIVIDGRLEEVAWHAAPAVTDFRRYQPVEGGGPPGRTEVRFLQDDRYLYVGVRVTDTGYPIRARVSARERINADDQVGIYLDTFHDGRSGYIFYFNALGIQQDVRHNAGNWNPNWDTAYRSSGRVIDDGYELEVAFPWRSLKFPSAKHGEVQTWGVILTRKVPHEGAKYAYPDITRNRPVLFSEEGRLVDVQPPRRGSGLELIPALTALQVWTDEEPRPFTEPDLDPLLDAFQPSLDVRFGITPDIGLAATFNPDFSQVESDAADVRLNARFAFRFTERRPFFLDGIDLFQDSPGTLYPRSVNQPLYGAKVTGREGALSIGLLHALDRAPLASVHELGTAGFSDAEVEGRWAHNTMARLRLDAFGGGWVGVVATDKRLAGTAANPGPAGIHNNVGADIGIPVGSRWIVRGAAQASLLSGVAEERGGLATASVERVSGIGTGVGLSGAVRSEGFRQEMGFLNQSGTTLASGWVDHTFEGTGAISTVRPGAWADTFHEFDGDYFRSAGVFSELLVNGIHNFNVSGRLDQRRQAGSVVDGWGAEARWFGQVGALLELGPYVWASRSLDFGTLGPALTMEAGGTVTLRTAGFRIDTTANVTRHVPEGLDPELAHRVRTTFLWQWTRSLGARLLVQQARRRQQEGVNQELLISPLLTWLDVPGTAAFLGWTERVDLLRGATTERAIFAKVSVLLRP